MSDKILVAYASKCGSTGKVAEAVGQTLCDNGTVVDVRLLKDVGNISPYRAVVLGSATRMGRWLPEAVKFVETHQSTLSQMPVAYFVVCLTMKEVTDENRRQAEVFVDQMRAKAPHVEPVGVGLFAGQMDFKTVPFLLRLIVKAMKTEEGDFRDWDAIREWAASVRPALLDRA